MIKANLLDAAWSLVERKKGSAVNIVQANDNYTVTIFTGSKRNKVKTFTNANSGDLITSLNHYMQ